MNNFEERLRIERLRLGLSQAELAEIGGVQRRAQVNYEAGERRPDSDYLCAITTAGINPSFLLSGNSSTDLGTELKRYGDAWQIVVTYLNNTGKTLPPARQREIAEALYRAVTPETSSAEMIDTLTKLAA